MDEFVSSIAMDENMIHYVTFHHMEWIDGTCISIVGISWKIMPIMPSCQLSLANCLQAIARLTVHPITSQTLEDNSCANSIKQGVCAFIPSLFCTQYHLWRQRRLLSFLHHNHTTIKQQ